MRTVDASISKFEGRKKNERGSARISVSLTDYESYEKEI